MLFRVDDNGTLKSFNVVDSTVVADLFDSTNTYVIGDYVFYNNSLYKFTSNHSGAWVAADVTEVNIIDEIPQSTSDLVNDSGFITSVPSEIFVGSTTPAGYTLYIDPDNSLSRGEGVNF